jgi:hypothetical protein
LAATLAWVSDSARATADPAGSNGAVVGVTPMLLAMVVNGPPATVARFLQGLFGGCASCDVRGYTVIFVVLSSTLAWLAFEREQFYGPGDGVGHEQAQPLRRSR